MRHLTRASIRLRNSRPTPPAAQAQAVRCTSQCVMLTVEQAEQLARQALRGVDAPELTVLSEDTIERPFGWVFFAANAADSPARRRPAREPIILVNKYSRQVFFTTTAFFVESCIDTYEAVLKAEGRGWCLTLDPPLVGRRKPGSFKSGILRRELEKVGLVEITPEAPNSAAPGRRRGTVIL
jgi:hypothetical protein